MAKDVVAFLSWAAEPEMNERKLVSDLNLCIYVHTQISAVDFVTD